MATIQVHSIKVSSLRKYPDRWCYRFEIIMPGGGWQNRPIQVPPDTSEQEATRLVLEDWADDVLETPWGQYLQYVEKGGQLYG